MLFKILDKSLETLEIWEELEEIMEQAIINLMLQVKVQKIWEAKMKFLHGTKN